MTTDRGGGLDRWRRSAGSDLRQLVDVVRTVGIRAAQRYERVLAARRIARRHRDRDDPGRAGRDGLADRERNGHRSRLVAQVDALGHVPGAFRGALQAVDDDRAPAVVGVLPRHLDLAWSLLDQIDGLALDVFEPLAVGSSGVDAVRVQRGDGVPSEAGPSSGEQDDRLPAARGRVPARGESGRRADIERPRPRGERRERRLHRTDRLRLVRVDRVQHHGRG
ncbi:hypothetical protein AB0E69_00500 [Kribbella sp. NPDC026611]|uniref:hypothetical protein n=1 Tax=Kribbella sp. NPDC026611 TaxID=3154911 RepID=UPI0033C2C97A